MFWDSIFIALYLTYLMSWRRLHIINSPGVFRVPCGEAYCIGREFIVVPKTVPPSVCLLRRFHKAFPAIALQNVDHSDSPRGIVSRKEALNLGPSFCGDNHALTMMM